MQLSEKVLFHTHEILEETFNSYGDGVLIVDHKTNKTFNFNKRLSELFFLTPQEKKGDNQFKDILKKINDPELLTLILKQVEKFPYKEVEGEIRLRNSSNEQLTIEFQSTPVIKQHHGLDVIIGRVWYFKDVTRLKEHEEKLIESSKMAALGEMAAGIAHEINNPLTIVKNYVSKLKKVIRKNPNENISQDLEKSLDIIEKANKRMINIIYGLKAISRNDKEDAFSYFSIPKMLSELEEISRERLGKSDIKLSINYNISEELLLYGHKAQVLQVFVNLINNAIDAIEEDLNSTNKKFVKLSLKQKNDKLIIYVQDSGKGIPKNIILKVFQPFFSTKKAGKGTGLGLSLSKKILEEHSASIDYTHDDLTPSTFTIKFTNWKSAV